MSYLGIDIGSLYISAVLIDEGKNILSSEYVRHHGELEEVLRSLLENFSSFPLERVVVTGPGGVHIEGLGEYIDPVVSQVEGARSVAPHVRNILYIGGGSFTLIHLDKDGKYLNHTSNTACASGTGAFLDQQALRLNLKPEELAERGAEATSPPTVATRCSVFAKSDIIHLQQEGFSSTEIAAGLCLSLGNAVLDILLKGKSFQGKTLFIGGVARNVLVARAVENRLEEGELIVPDNPERIAALGAALYAHRSAAFWALDLNAICRKGGTRGEGPTRPPLELRLSDYPEFCFEKYSVDEHGSEVALLEKLERGKKYEGALGIDIGSTSTKCIFVTRDRNALIHIYRDTAGDPIGATQLLFKALRRIEEEEGITLSVIAAGTTGSGRKMIRRIIHAEFELNEITAHAKAAQFIDPEVDTILEIGGQDSKFTQMRDGVVYNSVMNYVCAAGTGSFIAEQAKKLGIPIENYAGFTMGVRAPMTSDRCTVFMERDLDLLLSRGFTKKEVAAAVLYSVRDNYLNKVVGGLSIGNRIYFQGATARNKGLIAAFEELLKIPILVSPFCHLTGALGMALLILEREPVKRTFKGLAFAEEKVETEVETCTLCRNRCNLSIIHAGDEKVVWGAKCGREYSEKKRKVPSLEGYSLLALRERLLMDSHPAPASASFKIGMLRSLMTFTYLPFWKVLLGGLGAEIVLSPPTTASVLHDGQAAVTTECCAPLVASHGHAVDLFRRECDFFLIPYMIEEVIPKGISNSYFCPHVQVHPSVLRSLEKISIPQEKLLSPVIQFSAGMRGLEEKLFEVLGPALKVSRKQVRRVLQKALSAQQEFTAQLEEAGRKKEEELRSKKEWGIVLVGRPYNTLDPGLNLDLPRKIAEMGYAVFPLDALEFKPERIRKEWPNMYWSCGQKILAAAEYISGCEHLFPVFFSNFSCGPDSYLITYFKEIMGRSRKPYLVLQLDAHGADAGYMTRIEAAIESFKAWKPARKEVRVLARKGPGLKERILLIPPMEPIIAPLFQAIMEGCGYRARVIEENDETLAIGYRHSQGGECVPCPSSLGACIAAMEKSNLDPARAAFFMPTASGPCRFGQYERLDRLIFDQKGWRDLLIVSPSSLNAYFGLPRELRRRFWDAICIGDMLRKIVLKLRPYEAVPGEVNRVLQKWLGRIAQEYKRENWDVDSLFRASIREFSTIELRNVRKPKIGIVGEIYVRNDPFCNGNVIDAIEKLEGEALVSSVGEWFHYTAFLEERKALKGFHPLDRLKTELKRRWMMGREEHYTHMASPLLHDRPEPAIERILEEGQRFLPLEFKGEAILTLGRALLFIKEEKVDGIVNTSPTFCMPGTITTGIFPKIEKTFGIPAFCTFYDGSGDPNRILVPHLHFLRERLARPRTRARDFQTG